MAQGKRGERIVVVGAGVFGSWTAQHLQNAGHQVTVVDNLATETAEHAMRELPQQTEAAEQVAANG